ncbi:DH domain-containing protein [Favolaschia claudopus]|uniref:DH domain-containing protein n=1 Tax=Favolaschia claudopus TaxID=2862362 RepID=A0AAW0C4B1_9AGAR
MEPPALPVRSPLRPPPTTAALEQALPPLPPSSPLPTTPTPTVSTSSTLSKRQHALHELLSSERAYASDLTLILEVHIPLAQGPMTADDIRIVFGNIGELAELADVFCEALERTIGSALDDPDATDDKIGELFLRYAPELEGPYKQYITRHPSALAHLTALPATPELAAYHLKTRELAVSLSHAWDLASLLIKPIQRLLKYSLLLGAIIDATADTHPDRAALLSARTAVEDVAHAVNEGRRRFEVVKEVLTSPNSKKPPTVLRIKSFRSAPDPESSNNNSEAARVDRMAAELARIDVFAQQLARTAQDWARSASTSATALKSWAHAFALAIGLSASVRSEAYDAFLSTLTEAVLPASAALLPALAADILAPLARLLASAAQPRQLLASMAEHAPLHHHLLTMPVSPKNRPPPALLDASAHYLALRAQLAAELPAYITLLHRGLAALVRRLAAVQAAFFGTTRDAWAGLWDMLRVEGERNGGGAETEAVWRGRWGDVDTAVRGLAICQPLRVSVAQLTPAEAVARAYSNPVAINTSALAYAVGGGMGLGSPETTSPQSTGLPYSQSYGSPSSPHYERNNRDSSGASVHSSSSSGKVAHVSNVLAALDPPRRGGAPGVNVNHAAAMLGSLAPNHGHSTPPISGPYALMPGSGRPRGGSDAYSYSSGPSSYPYSPGSSSGGFVGWNENRATSREREREKERGKSPLRDEMNGSYFGSSINGKVNGSKNGRTSPTPTTQTARAGKGELGNMITEMGWDYGGMMLPPKKIKDVAREEEKAREKERERRRKEDERIGKEREKARKKEEKRAAKEGKIIGGSNSNSSEPSPRSSLASSRLALLEGAGYHDPTPKKKKSKSRPRDGEDPARHVPRRASDLTSNSNSNSNSSNRNSHANSSGSRAPSRPPSRGRTVDEVQLHSHPYARVAAQDEESFTARRATWLAAPALYSCRVVHPCTPPAAVSYFGFPFFALEEHALLGVLHEAGHPSTHPRLPLYVDEGEDCLLLCRDAAGEIGWALASFLAPLSGD